MHGQHHASVDDVRAHPLLGHHRLMALLVRRVPANELVASAGEPNQPPDRLLILPISKPHSLTRFEPDARRDQAKVTRPNAGRDHRVTRHPQVERVRVRQVNGCWCPVGVMRLRQVALRRAGYEIADRQPHPRREASQRDRRDLRVGRVGKLLVSLFGGGGRVTCRLKGDQRVEAHPVVGIFPLLPDDDRGGARQRAGHYASDDPDCVAKPVTQEQARITLCARGGSGQETAERGECTRWLRPLATINQ